MGKDIKPFRLSILGEEQLETEKDFSRYGRVNYVLARRLYLLSQVGQLQQSLGVTGDVAYTCETAAYFYLHHVSLTVQRDFSAFKKLTFILKVTNRPMN